MKPTPCQIANEARWALERESTSAEERRAIRNLGILGPFETGVWSAPIPRLHIPIDPAFRPTATPGHTIRHTDEDGQVSYTFLGYAIGPDDTVTDADGFPLQIIIGPSA